MSIYVLCLIVSYILSHKKYFSLQVQVILRFMWFKKNKFELF